MSEPGGRAARRGARLLLRAVRALANVGASSMQHSQGAIRCHPAAKPSPLQCRELCRRRDGRAGDERRGGRARLHNVPAVRYGCVGCAGRGLGRGAPAAGQNTRRACLHSCHASAPRQSSLPVPAKPHHPQSPPSHSRPPCSPPPAGKYVERVALPYVFKYLVSELAAMNIRCSLDVK